jgi:hypothetical protein
MLPLRCSNCRSHQDAYTEAAKALNGPDFDVMNAPLDKVAVYRAGRGKKHGRYLIGDGFIDTPSTISEVRALVSGSENEVRPQRSQQTCARDRLYEQEVEARKILEEKFDNQVEITKCLEAGYSALALVIFLLLQYQDLFLYNMLLCSSVIY